MNKLIPVEILLENGELSFEAEQILKKRETDDSHLCACNNSSSFDDQVKCDLENWMNNTVTYENYVLNKDITLEEVQCVADEAIGQIKLLGLTICRTRSLKL